MACIPDLPVSDILPAAPLVRGSAGRLHRKCASGIGPLRRQPLLQSLDSSASPRSSAGTQPVLVDLAVHFRQRMARMAANPGFFTRPPSDCPGRERRAFGDPGRSRDVSHPDGRPQHPDRPHLVRTLQPGLLGRSQAAPPPRHSL